MGYVESNPPHATSRRGTGGWLDMDSRRRLERGGGGVGNEGRSGRDGSYQRRGKWRSTRVYIPLWGVMHSKK